MTSRTLNAARWLFVPLFLLVLELGCAAHADRVEGDVEELTAPTAPAAQRKAPGGLPLERTQRTRESSTTKAEPGAECPPDAPYFCRDRCSASACPASCERTGCPESFDCKDCGDGFACVPYDAC